MGHKSALGCDTAHFSMLLSQSGLPDTTRPGRADTAEKARTEATPHLLPLVRQTGRWYGAGGVTWYGAYPAPPLRGSLPSKLSLQEGNRAEQKAGAAVPQASPMKPRYPIRNFGGLGCSAWGFLYRPSPCPATIQCSTWCSITPPTSTAGSSADTVLRPVPES